MLTLPSAVRIYVAAEAVDLRRGFDGLAAATRSLIGAGLYGFLCKWPRRQTGIRPSKTMDRWLRAEAQSEMGWVHR